MHGASAYDDDRFWSRESRAVPMVPELAIIARASTGPRRKPTRPLTTPSETLEASSLSDAVLVDIGSHGPVIASIHEKMSSCGRNHAAAEMGRSRGWSAQLRTRGLRPDLARRFTRRATRRRSTHRLALSQP